MISASPPLFASAVAAAVAGAVFAAGVAASALAVGGVPVDCDSAAVVGAGADVADSCARAGNENTDNASSDAHSVKTRAMDCFPTIGLYLRTIKSKERPVGKDCVRTN